MQRRKRKYTGPRCRRCRCTNGRACPGGCFWVESDLCSECFRKSVIKKFNAKNAANLVARFIMMETALSTAKRMILIREAYKYLQVYFPADLQKKYKYRKGTA